MLPTARFGAGPFQGSIDASIALLSGYNTNQQADPKSNLPTQYFIRHNSAVTNLLSSSGVDAKSESNVQGSVSNVNSRYSDFKSNWVHIFPEAFVHQVYPPHRYTLRYFKWGVARMILESTRPPIIVPIYAYGFDEVIPEDKEDDYNFLKRLGKSKLRVKVGQPLNDEDIAKFREEWIRLVEKEQHAQVEKVQKKIKTWKQTFYGLVPKTSWFWSSVPANGQKAERIDSNVIPIIPGDMDKKLREGTEAEAIRGKVSKYLRSELEKLRVSIGFGPEQLDFGDPEFWNPETGGCHDVPVMGNVNKLESHKSLNLFHLLKEELNIKTPHMPTIASMSSTLANFEK